MCPKMTANTVATAVQQHNKIFYTRHSIIHHTVILVKWRGYTDNIYI